MITWWLAACLVGVQDEDGDGYAPSDGDCDDTRAEVFPGADEHCNGRDDDCDGTVDGRDALDVEVFYLDLDGDGAGGTPVAACEAPEGAADTLEDCDDLDAGIYPEAEEICDGVDQDCDDEIDEGLLPEGTWWADRDGDGYGDPESPLESCEPATEAVDNDQDCDDDSAVANPEGVEVLDGVDNDCDGAIDRLTYEDATIVLDDVGDNCIGRSLATAGDTLLIGGFCGSDREVPGHVWLLDGPITASGDLSSAVTLAGEYNMAAGNSLAVLSETQIAVGAPVAKWASGAPEDGAVYVVDLPVEESADLVDVSTAVIRGISAPDRLGIRLVAGSYTSDDTPDLVVIATGYPDWDSTAFVFEGPLVGSPSYGSAEAILSGPEGVGMQMSVVADLGDLDGDGDSELAFGGYAANDEDGAVSVVTTPVGGSLDLADHAWAWIEGKSATRFGANVAGAAIDGDGTNDHLVSSTESGELHVFPGVSVATAETPADATITLSGLGDAPTLRPLGDLDGLTGDELLLGSRAWGGGGALLVIPGGLGDGTHQASDVTLIEVLGASGSWFGEAATLGVDVGEAGQEGVWVGAPFSTDYHHPGTVYGFAWSL